MTKTAAKALVADLRREAAKITAALTPTPQWIQTELGIDQSSPEYQARRDRIIRDALDRVDAVSAELRKGLDL